MGTSGRTRAVSEQEVYVNFSTARSLVRRGLARELEMRPDGRRLYVIDGPLLPTTKRESVEELQRLLARREQSPPEVIFARGLLLALNALELLDQDLVQFCRSIPISPDFRDLYANYRAGESDRAIPVEGQGDQV